MFLAVHYKSLLEYPDGYHRAYPPLFVHLLTNVVPPPSKPIPR